MATIEQQLTELVNQKNTLVNNLNTMGVEAATSETLNTLVPKVLDIETGGGGGGTTGEFMCQVVDYDGTILKQENLNTGDTFTLPTIPTHDKLIFQEWSSPVAIVDNTITVVNSDIAIGPVYKTTSGLTEIDITLTKVTGLTATCKMSGVKNWGDGTENSSTSHTYTNYGDYTITCNGTSIPAGASSSGGMFGSSSSNENYYATAVRIGELVISVGTYAFANCSGLTSITIPESVTSIGTYAFSSCSSLTSVSLGDSVTSIGDRAFFGCRKLTSITIPNSVTSIGNGVFYGCGGLSSITIPDGVTSIGLDAFSNCSSLTSITIPDSVTSIGNRAFGGCYNIKKYDFTSHTTISTLSNTNAFNDINGLCKIYVPDALYDDWIVATNWTTYADYIYKASEMEVLNDTN